MLYLILEYLKKNPLLRQMMPAADYLGGEEVAISVQAVASEPVIEQYADGGKLKQFTFKILRREPNYAPMEEETLVFLEKVGQFLEAEQNLPELAHGQTAQRFQVLRHAAVTNRSPGSRCRELVCRLIYYEEKGSES